MERFMRSVAIKITPLLLFILMFTVLTGCQKPMQEADSLPNSYSEAPGADTNEDAAGSPDQGTTPQTNSNPLPVPLDNGDYDTTETTLPIEEEDTSPSSDAESADSGQVDDSTGPKEQEANVSSNPKSQPEEFDRNRLTLIGVALGDNLDQVSQKLGKPIDEYTMDDETGPVSVYEYNGHSVGFDSRNQVLFVEVNSSQTVTGLKGLRVGHTDEDAIEALGKPDTSTTYVLSYTSSNTMLKLDLDPKTRTIQSIKLFAAE